MSPNMRPLTREEVRSVDQIAIQEYGMSGLVLMENAGRNAAEWIRAYARLQASLGEPVVILGGTGNNGGDGFVIARHLQLEGIPSRVYLIGDVEKLSDDARANYHILKRSNFALDSVGMDDANVWRDRFAGTPVIVDALLGTGATGGPRPPMAVAIEVANGLDAVHRIAIDLPTGLDADCGTTDGTAFRAHDTLTFVARKRGFEAPGAGDYTGRVHVLGIGAPLHLLLRFDPSVQAY